MRTPEKEKLELLLKEGKTTKEIACIFGKSSISTITNWLKKYNLEPNRPTKRFSKEEKEFIEQNYPEFGAVYCSEKLNRSLDSIYKYVSSNKIKKNHLWQSISKEDLELKYIKEKLSIDRVAEVFSLTPDIIYYAMLEHSIPISGNDRYYGNKHHGWQGYEEISGTHWLSIKQSAKKRRSRTIDFNITIEEAWNIYVKQKRKCAISGVDIWFSPTGSDRYKKTTASLDRINSSMGYSIENCQWLHKVVNQMKMSLSDTDFINWCHLISKNNLKEGISCQS